MLEFALFGAGRIGTLHARNLAANPHAKLVCVCDVVGEKARELAAKVNAKVAPDPDSVFADAAVDAVVIGTSTATHVDLMTAAARAGKAVLCEKPIDLDLARVNRCRDEIAGLSVPIQIGFNRRHDPHHRAVRDAVRDGAVGDVEMVVVTSRDGGLSPMEFIMESGGLFRDMTIHDFDMVRFILGEEVVVVSTMASVLIDPALAAAGHVDTAMIVMRAESGALCHINNSRRAVYGYDQRVEVFGRRGMVRSDNLWPTSVERYGAASTAVRDPLLDIFISRYAESYARQLDDFIDAVEDGREPSVTFEDGRRALILAVAAEESLAAGRPVPVSV
jgi:myo-inositol 2-dehydrogenase/D-chiro-inositol 1-dehydrogenase